MARMDLIYRAIKTQRRPNCSSLAQKLEVSAKTVQRDIDYMRYQLNLPIEHDKERHGFYFTEQVTHFPAVHVTESELVALLVARKAVEQYANTPFQKPFTGNWKQKAPNFAGFNPTRSFALSTNGISVLGIWSGAICALSIWAESAEPKSHLIASSDRSGST